MHILIVDDDDIDREHLKRSLRLSNGDFSVTEARTVDEGVIAFGKTHHDVILLDYSMPEKDGIEMLIELRGMSSTRRTAIVMMSSFEQDTVALECLRHGAQDFLLKKEITASRLHRAILHAQTRFELEEKLLKSYRRAKQLAESDALTGLSNRYQFDEMLRQAIDIYRYSRADLAVLMIDLDQFKYVNDYYGHAMGDELLRKVAKRFKNCTRNKEMLARLGGDEFAIILEDLPNIEAAEGLAKRLIASMEPVFELATATVSISASIGIAAPCATGDDLPDLLKHADIALYQAKRQCQGGYCVFEPEMEENFSYRYQLESRLRNALANREFEMYYQPVLDSSHQKIVGFEALLRWFVDGQFCSPDEFIPIAEETRLINDIGDWVLQEAISQLARWNKEYNADYTMAINVSSVQLSNQNLVESIGSKLRAEGIKPEKVEIELTETALLNDELEKLSTINGIHDLGCKIALDDFGTGFSSITHLRNFPIDIVKIDRSLMPLKDDDEKAIGLLRGVVLMIKSLNLKSIGEGIETESHSQLCQSLKIDRVQGYFLSRPMAPALIAEQFEL